MQPGREHPERGKPVDKLGFVFAGQGAQTPGMGISICEASPAAREVFARMDGIRPGTSQQCFTADAATLSRTINTQPCLFALDLACAAALAEHGVAPSAVAGFSLGEMAALAQCGILPFEDAARLVCARAQLMDDCASGADTAMAAILRLDNAAVEELCARIGDVYPVNYNCPGQIVVSGGAASVDALVAAAAEQKGRGMKLPVSGAFHSPYMQKASEGLAQYVRTLTFTPARVPLFANRTAAPYADPATEIAQQVKCPVLWERTVRRMAQDGVTTFIELGAGKTLSGLILKILPEAHILRVSDAETLTQTFTTLGR